MMPFMVFRISHLACAAASLGIAIPAAACDLHGPGQMGGFHRYNPFAHALNNLDSSPLAKKQPVIIRKEDAEKSEKAKKEAKRRQEALEAKAKAEDENARSADLRERRQTSGRSSLK